MVLGQEQDRDFSTRSEHKHGWGSRLDEVPEEVSGSHHRQPIDVWIALRSSSPQGVGSS